jgi:hypothetical protein
MNELDDFLAPTLARQVEAEQALISGDPGPRLAMTSTQDPVTVFGVRVPLRSGWDEVSETLRWLAARWSDATDYRFDVVAADVSGDRGGDGDRSRPRRVGSVGTRVIELLDGGYSRRVTSSVPRSWSSTPRAHGQRARRMQPPNTATHPRPTD